MPLLRTSRIPEKPTLKREHPALLNLKFIPLFSFCGSFCPPGSGYGRRKSMRIWIRNTKKVIKTIKRDLVDKNTKKQKSAYPEWRMKKAAA